MSNTPLIISKVGYKRPGWCGLSMGYTIRETKEVMKQVEDDVTKDRLRKKILFRQIGSVMMILTPCLYILGAIISYDKR